MKFSFLGGRMSQTAKAISLWEQVLSHTQFKRIIEIGTQSGNFSLYLYLWTLNREADFLSIDIKDQVDQCPVKRILEFPSLEADVFDMIPKLRELIGESGTTVLFCDGGDKQREFNTFAPFLKARDIIAVHDWKTEAFPENLDLRNLKEIYPKECDEEGFTRFFQRV